MTYLYSIHDLYALNMTFMYSLRAEHCMFLKQFQIARVFPLEGHHTGYDITDCFVACPCVLHVVDRDDRLLTRIYTGCAITRR